MKFTQPSFTVPTGHRPADSCSHGWLDVRGRCVFCGANVRIEVRCPPDFEYVTKYPDGTVDVVRSPSLHARMAAASP